MTTSSKLPFTLDTLKASESHYIPVIPENNHWLIYLRNNGEAGRKLGQKIIDSLLTVKTENQTGEFNPNGQPNKKFAGLVLEKWHGLLQEERQVLKSQIEEYFNLSNEWDKFVAQGSNELDLEPDTFQGLIDNPYEEGFDLGQKIEQQYLETGKQLAQKLFDLNTQLNDDAIVIVLKKRLNAEWTNEETALLHPDMKKAISDFISNERQGWVKTTDIDEVYLEAESEGNDTQNQTGLASTTTSKVGQTMIGSTT